MLDFLIVIACLFINAFFSAYEMACGSIKLGKVPILVKEMESEEINYEELIQKKKNMQSKKEIKKDCLQVFVFIPTKMTVEMDKALNQSCQDSNLSFDNKLYHRFFYLLYGQECFINEHYCEGT